MSLMMGLLFVGLGVLLMVRRGAAPALDQISFTGYQVGGVLVGYGLLRLARAWFLWRKGDPRVEPEQEE